MRNTFIDTLCELAEQDERIWLLCGDLGFSVLERFAQRFPDRYVNVGVAEQNMMGIAAGLASAGKKVFTYSIVNFAMMRCLEQLRDDVCYHNLDVTAVAVGGGVAYATNGYTHHGIEDLAMTRTLPNITVVAPADPVEARLATQALAAHSGPAYLRLAKGGEPVVHPETPDFALGKAIVLRQGHDVTLIATGVPLGAAMTAADLLAEQGIAAGVMSVPTVQPIDAPAIEEAARTSHVIVTVEEHRPMGGLGGAVAEVLACMPEPRARLVMCGVTTPPTLTGSANFLRERNGLDAAHLVATVTGALARQTAVRAV